MCVGIELAIAAVNLNPALGVPCHASEGGKEGGRRKEPMRWTLDADYAK